MYNDNTGGNARQLLNWASNLNVLTMQPNDLNILLNGLEMTLKQEQQFAKQTNDQNRFNASINMMNELSTVNINSITPDMVNNMLKMLIQLLTTQIQSVNNTNTFFTNNNNSMFSNQQSNMDTLNDNSFGMTSTPNMGNISTTQANMDIDLNVGFDNNINNSDVKSSFTETETKHILTIDDVELKYSPLPGNEFRPLYDQNNYILTYKLDGNKFEYITMKKGNNHE